MLNEKGLIAEEIVCDFFKEAGFEVYEYGYERVYPGLAKKVPKIWGRAAEYIRHQPDFVVVNKNNEAFFIEVKFRSYKLDVDRDIFPYPNCYVVLLTKDYILAQSTLYLFRNADEFKPITYMPPFSNIPYDLIKRYVDIVRRKLGDESLGGQILGNLIKSFSNLDVVRKPSPFSVKKHEKERYRNR